MAVTQTTDEIQAVLTRLVGHEISSLQVLGINSLKSMSSLPEALAGQTIAATSVEDRTLTIATASYQVVFDLQRTGKLVWLGSATPYVMAAGTARPTVRLTLVSGQGLDLMEPAKTKRITVTISAPR